jgi:hypothetical protein
LKECLKLFCHFLLHLKKISIFDTNWSQNKK